MAKPVRYLALIFALACCALLGACANEHSLASTGTADAVPGPATMPDTSSSGSSAAATTGNLSFTLESTEWVPAEDGSIVVRVFGENEQGEHVEQQLEAAPGQQYLTAFGPGYYEFSLLTGVPVKGHRLFKAKSQRITFDGTKDENVVLTLTLDTDSMKNRQSNPDDGQKTKLPGM